MNSSVVGWRSKVHIRRLEVFSCSDSVAPYPKSWPPHTAPPTESPRTATGYSSSFLRTILYFNGRWPKWQTTTDDENFWRTGAWWGYTHVNAVYRRSQSLSAYTHVSIITNKHGVCEYKYYSWCKCMLNASSFHLLFVSQVSLKLWRIIISLLSLLFYYY